MMKDRSVIHVVAQKLTIIILSIFSAVQLYGQVGINTPDPHASAALDVTAKNKGFLPPRITLTGVQDTLTIANPAVGLLIYNTVPSGTGVNAVIPGYHYWNGSRWALLGASTNTWGTLGNSGTSPETNFIGTNDNQDLILKRGGVIAGRLSGVGIYNTSFGVGSYKGNVGLIGRWNTAIGYESLKGEDGNMEAHDNTAVGSFSLTSNTVGEANTAVGFEALKWNTSGKWNIGVGYRSLGGNKTGSHNIAIGTDVMANNPKGLENTALGFLSLANQTSGNQNVALGAYSGQGLMMGDNNIMIGKSAARNQSSGSNNIVIGSNIDLKNTSGSNQLNIGNSIYGTNINAGVNTYANIGINTAAPGNSLEVKSAEPNTSGVRLTNLKGATQLGTNAQGDIIDIQTSVKTIAADYSIAESDEIILVDTSSVEVTLTLPSSSQKGRKIVIKKMDNSPNKILIQSASQIDKQTNISVSLPFSAVTLLDDGSSYWIIGT